MPVFRVVKNANYTTMSNYHLRDKTLSLKGKGLQSMLFESAGSVAAQRKGLSEICLEGRDSINAALRELEQHGYLIRKQRRLPDGTLGGIEYWIYEKPQPCTENPDTDNPVTADPAAGEPWPENKAQIITNESSTEESITEGMGKALPPPVWAISKRFSLGWGHGKLRQEFPADWQSRLERLSEYMASTGKSYRNHLATIRSWAKKDAAEPKKQVYRHENYRFKEETAYERCYGRFSGAFYSTPGTAARTNMPVRMVCCTVPSATHPGSVK